jgi:hypothetical protein
VFDAGPLGMGSLAAHGHADALSFNLSISGIPIIVDPGTYAYHTDAFWRDYFRGTSAHNTVRIDRENQSQIGGNFLWSRHAQTSVSRYQLESEHQFIEAWHDGYEGLSDSVSHRRSLHFDSKVKRLIIEDELQCDNAHFVEIFFHFPEYVTIERSADSVVVGVRDRHIRIHAEHNLISECFHGDEKIPLGWISYRFDSKIPAYTLRYSGQIPGPATLTTMIEVH